MNYLDAVNRLLRIEGIVSGDDTDATSFSDTAHSNSINLAKIAIDSELSDCVSDKVIPYEEADGHITLAQSTQKYSLASDFVRMIDENPFLEKVDAATSTGVAQGERLYAYNGGEKQLRSDQWDYRTKEGDPTHFYFVGGTSNQIGIWQVPDSNANGEIYRYFYQKAVSVTNESDLIPFINEDTARAFVDACAIRFRAIRLDPDIRKQLYPSGVENDPEHQAAKARLFELIRREPPPSSYGRKYC